jgi:hypothetical protein
VRATHTDELQRGALTEGPQALLVLELEFSSALPVWHMSGIDGEKWGRFHIEQVGRVHGSIRRGEQRVQMDGSGWRDHSRGPRDVSAMGRHCWIHGRLSGERAFALTTIDNLVDGRFERGLNKVIVWDRGEIQEGRCEDPPFLLASTPPPPRYAMTIHYPRGRIELAAELARSLPHSTAKHMDCFDGVTPEIAHVVTYEQGTVFTVDGERFDGHTERSFLLHS